MSSIENGVQVADGGRITVVGLGYIGLPTAVVFANNGWLVTGVDVSDRTVEMVNTGELPFVEEGLEEVLRTVTSSGHLVAQTATPPSDIFIVSVPTPFKDDHEADLSYIEAAADEIAGVLRGGELVVLESTSPPGTTERMAQRILDARTDLSMDGSEDRPVVYFAHAPERVLPGRIMVEMTANDRIIGGTTPEAAEFARQVYSTFCEGELSITDARTAEMSKLAENAFRDVNIAFANELSLIADDLDINVWELIELANKHPRVNILQPGPGVGGHCIAVDPWFIVSSDPENSNLIRTAREVNDSKPDWVIDSVEKAMKDAGPDAKVALLGLAFKPNIDDLRQSPALEIAERLIGNNPDTEFLICEPNIARLPDALRGSRNASLVQPDQAMDQGDVVVLLVAHDAFVGATNDSKGSQIVIDTAGFWELSESVGRESQANE
ncbi:UDP-N-acetyl-D-mannosamine dehydrogenase [Actinomycetaceae bacterium MB13-C1-2]|nr:UDP-N-acetyl-D-mannosamine dehydrogenase [Actinomycetaceae bacterium MB13-C1-2]